VVHGWGVYVLPYLEQSALYQRYDFTKSLYDDPNASVILTQLNMFQCPATPEPNRVEAIPVPANVGRQLPGIPAGPLQDAPTDYQGRAPLPPPNISEGGGWGAPFNGQNWLAGSLFDGTDPAGAGPCIINCTNKTGRNLYSFHPSGVNVVLADGSVRHISAGITPKIVAFMVTKKKGEVIPSE